MSLKYAPAIAFTAITVFGFGSPFLVSWHPEPTRAEFPARREGPALFIEQMGDPRLSVSEHFRAARQLNNAGIAAIPYAIDAMSDPRIFNPKHYAANGPPNGPSFVLSVGEECASILTSLLHINPFLGYDRTIKDWRAWWKLNCHKSLAAMHADIQIWEESHEPQTDS